MICCAATGEINITINTSQEELDGIIATAELRAIPGMVESILKARKTPLAECVREENFDWKTLIHAI